MPRLSPRASKEAHREAASYEMRKFHAGTLHSGKGGPIVTDPAQAAAISMSVSGQSKRKKK
jgi:hypothetical protein